ncbi:MAG: oligoribonuclease, partial [Victivallales bacterium]|nr:oligoribonuclease [Victivallales bacterium]
MQSDKNLVWIDMEMTGLRPDIDRVLEIACIVTDHDLNTVAEGPVIAVWQPEDVLEGMSDWCIEHHTASGLLDRVRGEGVSEAEAERMTLDFLREHVVEKTSPLCGNSVGQDRRF